MHFNKLHTLLIATLILLMSPANVWATKYKPPNVKLEPWMLDGAGKQLGASCDASKAYAFLETVTGASNRNVVITPRGTNSPGINANFACRLAEYIKAVRALGCRPKFHSAYRSYAKQLSMCGPRGRTGCAAPGRSCHQYGAAVDITGASNGQGCSRAGGALAAKYGLIFGYSGRGNVPADNRRKGRNHFQCIENRTSGASSCAKNSCGPGTPPPYDPNQWDMNAYSDANSDSFPGAGSYPELGNQDPQTVGNAYDGQTPDAGNQTGQPDNMGPGSVNLDLGDDKDILGGGSDNDEFATDRYGWNEGGDKQEPQQDGQSMAANPQQKVLQGRNGHVVQNVMRGSGAKYPQSQKNSNTFNKTLYRALLTRFDKTAGVGKIYGLNPNFAQCMVAMLRGAEASGHNARIVDGYRSKEEQERKRYDAEIKHGKEQADKYVEHPLYSTHVRGIAADMEFGQSGAQQWFYSHAKEFGLHFPLAHKPWHVVSYSELCASSAPSPYGNIVDNSYSANDIVLPPIEDVYLSNVKQINILEARAAAQIEQNGLLTATTTDSDNSPAISDFESWNSKYSTRGDDGATQISQNLGDFFYNDIPPPQKKLSWWGVIMRMFGFKK